MHFSALFRTGAVVAGLGAVALLVVNTTNAAFSASTDNNSNSFAAGTVTLSDDDAGSLLFNLSNMKPGDTSTKCVNVAYAGSLPADVKLYGTVGGTGLADYLTTTIDVGSGADGGSSLSCTGFTSSSTLHNDTLAAFGAANTNYSTGLGGFAGATNPSSKSYRISVTLQDDNGAQGKNATATFTWEAQNN
jgi:predicted ribosomally synthesized peptide with SipW-like signal peptide